MLSCDSSYYVCALFCCCCLVKVGVNEWLRAWVTVCSLCISTVPNCYFVFSSHLCIEGGTLVQIAPVPDHWNSSFSILSFLLCFFLC